MTRIRMLNYTIIRFLKTLPFAILGAVIPAFFIFTIAGFIKDNLYRNQPIVKTTVGVVTEDIKEKTFNKALDILNNTESTKISLNFEQYDTLEHSIKELKNGNVVAVMYFPRNVVQGIKDGENVPVKIYFSDSTDISQVFIKEFANALGVVLASAETSIYTISDFYSDQDIDTEETQAAYNAINAISTIYMTSREKLFHVIDTSSETSHSLTCYYIASGIVLFLLFFGCAFCNNMGNDDDSFLSMMRCRHIGSIYYMFIKVFSYFICLTIMLGSALLAYSKISSANILSHNTGSVILTLIVTILFFSAYTLFVFRLSHTPSLCILIMFIIGSVLSLLSGLIIPMSFFPDAMRNVGEIMPTAYIHEAVMDILSGYKCDVLKPILIYTIAFFLLSVIITAVRKREQ